MATSYIVVKSTSMMLKYFSCAVIALVAMLNSCEATAHMHASGPCPGMQQLSNLSQTEEPSEDILNTFIKSFAQGVNILDTNTTTPALVSAPGPPSNVRTPVSGRVFAPAPPSNDRTYVSGRVSAPAPASISTFEQTKPVDIPSIIETDLSMETIVESTQLKTEALFQPSKDMPDTPYPFDRELSHADAPNGVDVYILEELLRRHFAKKNNEIYQPIAGSSALSKKTATYTEKTARNVELLQQDFGLPVTGVLNKETAKILVQEYIHLDNYRDNNVKASEYGMKFKIYIPVHRDRSVETIATVFDADNNPLYQFKARTHGKTDPKDRSWPQYDNTVGQNEFVLDGNTPTGLSFMDLNTPEPPGFFDEYGPYDVTRFTVGIMGNAAVALPHIRNGILMHTGNWLEFGWDGKGPMPNSSGCVHSPPEEIKRIAEILKGLGVVANKNPFGQLPYPFENQGIVSVELID